MFREGFLDLRTQVRFLVPQPLQIFFLLNYLHSFLSFTYLVISLASPRISPGSDPISQSIGIFVNPIMKGKTLFILSEDFYLYPT